MKKIDYLSLNGRVLKTFLAVLEEQSVTRAAARLDVTQSAVSHTLERLREVLGDPLFVRTGNRVEPTRRALDLQAPVLAILDQLKELTSERPFDPAEAPMSFTVAANDFQRELLFPTLFRELRSEGVDLRLNFLPSGVPTTSLLREARCDLAVTPFPPDSPDIFQGLLFRHADIVEPRGHVTVFVGQSQLPALIVVDAVRSRAGQVVA